MRILLIQPPRWNENLSIVIGDQEPLKLEIIAGILPNHEINLLDMRFEPEELFHTIESFNPQIVGITGVTC